MGAWTLSSTLAVASLAAAVPAPGWAETPPPVRAEVAVREVGLSNGERRYAVPVTIGGTTVDAGLDTGSTGLRVLPGVLGADDARATSRADSYAYGAGARLDGVAAQATVAVGALKDVTTLQLVKTVGCSSEQPRCAARRVRIDDYGIQGDGLPKEGFKAILGVDMAQAGVANPFEGLGARSWIVELPRPGESAPGRIVLNPAAEETAGYVALPVTGAAAPRGGGLHDAVPGCLVNDATRARFCGVVLLDSGAPGLRVATPDARGAPWREGTPATLVLTDGSGRPAAAETLTIGLRAHASRLTFEVREPPKPAAVFAGLSPYFAFSVLYDADKGTVGFKPRPPAPGGPVGRLVAP